MEIVIQFIRSTCMRSMGQCTMEAIRFYRPEQRYGELSNFYICDQPLVFDGKPFATSEHLYHYLKYCYPGAPTASLEYAEYIRTINTPYKAKLLAKQSTPRRYEWQQALSDIIATYRRRGVSARGDWDSIKRDCMLLCLRIKFQTDRQCRRVLLSTGNATLIEASSRDYYWGEGIDGNGLNMLGTLLVQVRVETRETAALAALPPQAWEDEV